MQQYAEENPWHGMCQDLTCEPANLCAGCLPKPRSPASLMIAWAACCRGGEVSRGLCALPTRTLCAATRPNPAHYYQTFPRPQACGTPGGRSVAAPGVRGFNFPLRILGPAARPAPKDPARRRATSEYRGNVYTTLFDVWRDGANGV